MMGLFGNVTNSVSRRSTPWDLLLSKKTLEQLLTKNIIPFWYAQGIDREDGGYRLNHDLRGQWKGRAKKQIVTQARTVWFFARLARTEYGASEHIEAARHGFEFLCDRMWDKEYGGFFWEVESSGHVSTKPDKHLYGQAFGLYALAEYAVAAKDPRAAALARELFGLLENYAHDEQDGGYRECLRRDWTPMSNNATSYLGHAPDIKLMNTHLHLMEAMTVYYRLEEDPAARERLVELIFILSNAVVRTGECVCTDPYQCDWAPHPTHDSDRVSYGHNLENIWLLVEARRAARISNGPLLDLYRKIFDYALRYGFDQSKGGFYESGILHEAADRREKIWWVQAEALVSSLEMYRLTREEVYSRCFSRTLKWIVDYQADWQHGDWHARVGEDGQRPEDKAGAWKSPYHNGRAMMRCLEILPSLAEG